jgi:hypothetical protein
MLTVFDDIQTEIELFFNDLNWTYILIYVFILYGIKHKEEFEWYNKLFDGGPLSSLRAWVAGIVTALVFMFFKWGECCLSFGYVSQLLRSWILVLVFNSVFSSKINKYDKE